MIRIKVKNKAVLITSRIQIGLQPKQIWYGKKYDDKWEMTRDNVTMRISSEMLDKYFEVE